METTAKTLHEPFEKWQANRPYKKMVLFLTAFPAKNICRVIMEDRSFKRQLSKCMKEILIGCFTFNKDFAVKCLTEVVHSEEFSKNKNLLLCKDVLLFAFCLSEVGIHPDQSCCYVENSELKECARTDSTKPFFALVIGDCNLVDFLISQKWGNPDMVSKELNFFTNACKNDFVVGL